MISVQIIERKPTLYREVTLPEYLPFIYLSMPYHLVGQAAGPLTGSAAESPGKEKDDEEKKQTSKTRQDADGRKHQRGGEEAGRDQRETAQGRPWDCRRLLPGQRRETQACKVRARSDGSSRRHPETPGEQVQTVRRVQPPCFVNRGSHSKKRWLVVSSLWLTAQ